MHSFGFSPKFQEAVFWFRDHVLGGAVVDFAFWRGSHRALLVEIGSRAAHPDWGDVLCFDEQEAMDNPRKVALEIYSRLKGKRVTEAPHQKPFTPRIVLRKIKPTAAPSPTGV